MTRYNAARVSLGVILLAVGLLGCPELVPLLTVSPTAFDFTASQSSDELIIANTGTGSMDWEIQSLPAWLTAVPMSGTVTDSSQVVTLVADPTGLALGTHQGQLLIHSDGGDRALAVSITREEGPVLNVDPTSLDFGSSGATRTFTISNGGTSSLSWEILSPLPNYYTVSNSSGTLAAGASQLITVTFNRATADSGTHAGPISINSNGGTAIVNVTANVQALSVTPLNLDFDLQLDTLSFVIANTGSVPLNWTINSATLPSWLTLDPSDTVGTLAAGTQTTIQATADRTGLPVGETTGEISVASEYGSDTVDVRVMGFDPALTVTPETLDLGSIDSTGTFTIQNTGTGSLAWTAEEGSGTANSWTAGDIGWLSITSASSGTAAAGGSSTLTIAVDRLAVTPDPDTPFVGRIRILSADGEAQVLIIQMLAIPPTLRVLPETLNFSTTYIERKLALWNAGLGTVNWRIDTSSNPSWLTITPVDGGGIASGSVSGDQTDMVTVTVNRTGLPPATADYTCSFTVTATDGSSATIDPVTVDVSMNVAPYATIVVDTGENADGYPNVDGDEIPYLPLGSTLKTGTFDILNQGTGNLVWSIDTASLPTWITSISPAQGTILPLGSITVTVTVDRSSLSSGEESHTFPIVSNDPANPSQDVRIEMTVPKLIVIAVDPAQLDFGTYGISDAFGVCNYGDAGTELTFQVTTNKPWLYLYPETGSSTGTASSIKDWRSVNVSIDRSQLDGTGAAATITVSAYELDENGQRVIREDITPVEIAVSVEAAQLTFESAGARTRIPSLVRYVFLLRDLAYEPIPFSWDEIGDYVNGFAVYENDTAVERVESGQFLTNADNLRADVVLMLDYSGSMYAAAQSVTDTSVSGAADPLQALYELCIPSLIDELPSTYNIALMEFHERSQPSRVVTAPDNGPIFTRDKDIIKARLANLSIPDHGATELLVAATQAALVLDNHAASQFQIAFDDADMKGVVCVSDGRTTTPPGNVTDVADTLSELGVQFFPVGWGSGIFHEPLARLASKTGGHYYPTRTEVTGATTSTGAAEVRPIVDELLDLCTTDGVAVDPCDQSLAKDFKSQVIFSYVTLTEDKPVTVLVSGTFDNPNDDEGVCLADQGVITGSITEDELDFTTNTGDVRLGQISLRSEGVQGTTAQVVVRAEYIPRNIDSFEFQITSAESFTVSPVPASAGGIVADWTLTDLGGNLYSLTRPAAIDMLAYGAFGDMLYLNFTGVAAPFTVDFLVTDPAYTGTSDFEKYFTAPDRITVQSTETVAPAFPTPQVTIVTPPSDDYILDFGTGTDSAQLEIRNVGGNHVPTGVWLNWYVSSVSGYFTFVPDTGWGILDSSADVAALTLNFDRSLNQGTYSDVVVLEFDGNTLAETFTANLTVYATVLPPVLSVSPTTITFGPTDTTRDIVISNIGQSTLDWSVPSQTFPGWLTASTTTGSVPLNETNTLTLTVDRTDLATGAYAFAFTLSSDGGEQTINITLIVP